MININNFWKNKKVLITGHTGFKGVWLSCLLNRLGANIYGISLPLTEINKLYTSVDLNFIKSSFYLDIRDKELFNSAIDNIEPEVVIHLAAQPLVIEGFASPVDTFEINFNGTLHLLEKFKNSNIDTLLIITTDKVYKESNTNDIFNENSILGGKDPYSCSKSCVELLTYTYWNSFIEDQNKSLATARAGNVIGPGDYSPNRLLPDIFSSLQTGKLLELRSPYSIRPWQHVIEPLFGYIKLVEFIHNKNSFMNMNFGPEGNTYATVLDLVHTIDNIEYKIIDNQFKETNILKLDSSKAKSILNYKNIYDYNTAVKKTLDGYKLLDKSTKSEAYEFIINEIDQYINEYAF